MVSLITSMPEMTLDLIYALSLLGVAASVAVVYGLRVLTKGKAEFDRVDKQGGSALLGKGVMHGAYWSLQPLARLLIFLRITPNMVSWASFGFALGAGACLSVGHFGFGAVFATISAFLDTLDGMVARLTGVSSDAGEVLDAAVDRYAEFFFLGGLVIYYREIPLLLVVTLVALIGSFMVSYSSAKAEALQVSAPKGAMRRPERAVYLTLGALFSPITIPLFEQIRPYGIAIGHPMVIALGLVAVMSNVSAAERLWAIARAVRLRETEERAKAAMVSLSSSDQEEDASSTSAKAPVKLN
ncbi:MAG: CDP-alcohol phosphatidyltransferase family protein [Bdellovibrionales bacterium]|nr:CDP-alcohol phosphatidyltransferase family protein [Bdellovibrionales bacterium]